MADRSGLDTRGVVEVVTLGRGGGGVLLAGGPTDNNKQEEEERRRERDGETRERRIKRERMGEWKASQAGQLWARGGHLILAAVSPRA